MAKDNFVQRVYKERGGKAQPPDFDVQAGRGARNMTRNLIKGISRGVSSMEKMKGKPSAF